MPYKDAEARKAKSRAYYAENKHRWRETYQRNRRRWHAENREASIASMREYSLKRNYGITSEDYARMETEQAGNCKICKKPPRKNTKLHVDHCHTTGAVRGLLCVRCNMALGWFETNRAEIGSYLCE